MLSRERNDIMLTKWFLEKKERSIWKRAKIKLTLTCEYFWNIVFKVNLKRNCYNPNI